MRKLSLGRCYVDDDSWGLKPSENRRRGKLSEYEFIDCKQRWPEDSDLQRDSEKVMQFWTSSDNLSLLSCQAAWNNEDPTFSTHFQCLTEEAATILPPIPETTIIAFANVYNVTVTGTST